MVSAKCTILPLTNMRNAYNYNLKRHLYDVCTRYILYQFCYMYLFVYLFIYLLNKHVIFIIYHSFISFYLLSNLIDPYCHLRQIKTRTVNGAGTGEWSDSVFALTTSMSATSQGELMIFYHIMFRTHDLGTVSYH